MMVPCVGIPTDQLRMTASFCRVVYMAGGFNANQGQQKPLIFRSVAMRRPLANNE